MPKNIISIEQIDVSGPHYEVGYAIGEKFSLKIHRALDAYRPALEKIRDYHHTRRGQTKYQNLISLHRSQYPEYFNEYEGIADGAGVSFEDMFLANMRGEYRGYLQAPPHGCSDISLVTEEMALIGHNEDGSPAFCGNTYIVHAKIKGKPSFTAFTYPGFLCGNAFGFNSEGICFSVDDVQPQGVQIGYGRHFLARSLLDACSMQDAIERVTIPDRASGFSYTIGSIKERRIVQVEVAPESYNIRELQGFNFHANHYQELSGENQIIKPSSQARLNRARVLLQRNPPSDKRGILTILGDRVNVQYPIYCESNTQDENMTFCTALFDLDERSLQIYTGHPIDDSGDYITYNM